jgi:DNA-binding MarR family transcriptional regulator
VGIFDKLDAKGLITRQRSDRDRRIVHAHLTDAGRAVLDQAPDPLGARLRAAFDAMPDVDRAHLLANLARLGALADVPTEPPAP